jgi:hypothetical protein
MALASKKLNDSYSYTATWKLVDGAAKKGCHWCHLLKSNRDNTMLQDTLKVTVSFREKKGEGGYGTEQTLRIIMNGRPNSVYYIYTDSGTS